MCSSENILAMKGSFFVLFFNFKFIFPFKLKTHVTQHSFISRPQIMNSLSLLYTSEPVK
jgi:hypothetical protein